MKFICQSTQRKISRCTGWPLSGLWQIQTLGHNSFGLDWTFTRGFQTFFDLQPQQQNTQSPSENHTQPPGSFILPSPFIDNLEVPPLQEAAHLWFACEHDLHELAHHLLLVALGGGSVPLLQPQLALPAEQQHETHLKTESRRSGQNSYRSVTALRLTNRAEVWV